MFVTIINDCTDANVVGRQGTRIASLLGVPPTYVGVGHAGLVQNNDFLGSELEAAGCLVDVLDAAEGRQGLVLVNVANRHGKGKKWPNGTPFGYFYYDETLVVSSIDGTALSLVKKFGIACKLQLMDVATVMDYFVSQSICSPKVNEHVKYTQFRSFDFTPRVGAYLIEGGSVPSETYDFDNVADLPAIVWFVDNFGNCKTSVLPDEVGFLNGKRIETRFGEFVCYDRLKDVPSGETALIVGSSGIKDKRLLEIVVQGESAKEKLGIQVGSAIF